MKRIELQGAIRGKLLKTTFGNKTAPGQLDRVNRQFGAPSPNRLWLSDFTYAVTYLEYSTEQLETMIKAQRVGAGIWANGGQMRYSARLHNGKKERPAGGWMPSYRPEHDADRVGIRKAAQNATRFGGVK